jgi:hypothetical protein
MQIMVQFEEGMPVVGLFAGPNTGPDVALRKWVETVDHLQMQDAIPVLVNEGVEWGEDGSLARGVLLGTTLEECIKASEISVLSGRDYTSRYKGPIPVLCAQSVVKLARDKAEFSSKLPEYTAHSFRVDPSNTADAESFLHDLPGDRAALKPITGSSGEGVIVGPKAEVAEEAKNRLKAEPNTVLLLQEALDSTSRQSGLRGLTETDNMKLARTVQANELRFFLSNDKMVPVLRVNEQAPILDSRGYYIYVDPETVSQEAFDLGKATVQRICEVAEVDEIHGALDLVHRANGELAVLEFNVKEPGLPKRNESVAADWIKANLAEQLIRMAR